MKAKKKFRPLGTSMSVMVFGIVVFSTLMVALFSYFTFRTNAIDEHAQQALMVAQSVSLSIDTEKYQEIAETMEKNEYWYDVKSYLDEVKSNTDIDYLYILDISDDASLCYFAEGNKPSDDFIGGDLGEAEDPDAFAGDVDALVNTGKAVVTDIYDSEGYGLMVSGFAPITNKNGKVVGVVGADILLDHVFVTVDAFGMQTMFFELALGLLFLPLTAIYIKRKVGKPLADMAEASKHLAEGNLYINIKDHSHMNNEIGMLNNHFKTVMDTFVGLVNDIDIMSRIHTDGDYEYKIDASKYYGAYRDVVTGLTAVPDMYIDNFMELLNVLQSYAKGDFEANVKKYPGKQAASNNVIDGLRANFMHINKEINGLAESALKGDLQARASTEGFQGGWLKIITNLNSLSQAIANPIHDASEALAEIANGNLSAKMTGVYNGDFSLIKNSLNKMTSQLTEYIIEIKKALKAVEDNDLRIKISKEFVGDFSAIKDSINAIVEAQNKVMNGILAAAEQVNVGAEQISQSSGILAQGASEQAITVGLLMDSISDINKQTGKNVQNTETADKLSSLSVQNASDGSKEMNKMLTSMREIKQSSANIAKIIRVIEDIAFQTNLLALNAAVEAARAGEHGRGFSIVAEEVRNLSVRSQAATKETQLLIETTVAKINEGTETAKTTSAALNKIVENIHSISGIISEIASSSKKQADAVTHVSDGVGEISDVVRQTASTSQESAASAEELSSQSEMLNALLSVFTLAK